MSCQTAKGSNNQKLNITQDNDKDLFNKDESSALQMKQLDQRLNTEESHSSFVDSMLTY